MFLSLSGAAFFAGKIVVVAIIVMTFFDYSSNAKSRISWICVVNVRWIYVEIKF